MKFKSTTNLGEIAPRLAFIDNSKGIAIIFVVIGHVVYHCICGKNNSMAYTHPHLHSLAIISYATVYLFEWNFGFKPISKF